MNKKKLSSLVKTVSLFSILLLSASTLNTHNKFVNAATISNTNRIMEDLGRGTVAVRSNNNQVFISWRILGLEFNAGVKFNLYRNNVKIASNLETSNYVDNITTNETYSVSAIVNSIEQPKSPSVYVAASKYGTNTIPSLEVPIRVTAGYVPQYVWVGDLDGDGEYDFVLNKQPTDATKNILVEAYKRDGTFLWQVDCGPNSVNKDNIEPGSSTIGAGHGDGITVYDMNNDGKSEVMIKTSNGVKFANGITLTDANNNKQFISVLNGMTGVEISRAPVPTDYLADGPLNGHFGIAYLNGINPSIVFSAKNRIGNGAFNMVVSTWTMNGNTLTQTWKYLVPKNGNLPDGHQIRCMDVDGDGKDEICPFGYMIDDNGTLMYSLGNSGVVHGDRFSIGDLDPNRPGLEGYAIQQDNPSGLAWVYYDAKTGNVLKSQTGPAGTDYARGCALDLDPRYKGYEFYTFTNGLYNVNGQITSTSLLNSYPNLKIWWDGDLLSEMLDNSKLVKWNYTGGYEDRTYTFKNVIQATSRNTPAFYGDILGDWREEVVYTSDNLSKLLIFTTTTPTSTRLYTLAHNPEYRLSLTNKGYYQSTMCDFYLGDGMQTPSTPNITYKETQNVPSAFIYGDVNGDNVINSLDYAIMKSYILQVTSSMPSKYWNTAGDLNGDGQINSLDYAYLKKYILGLIDTFPVSG